IPLEAGIEDRAISQTKGCYVGQEVVIRILHRGGGRVVRRLVAWAADAESPADAVVPGPGTLVSVDGKDVGRVTSAAWSPSLRRQVGRGHAPRDPTEPGPKLPIAVDPPVAAAVATLPLVVLPTGAVSSGA